MYCDFIFFKVNRKDREVYHVNKPVSNNLSRPA